MIILFHSNNQNYDEELFNEGLEMQLALHQSYARGETKDTDEEFVCDEV